LAKCAYCAQVVSSTAPECSACGMPVEHGTPERGAGRAPTASGAAFTRRTTPVDPHADRQPTPEHDGFARGESVPQLGLDSPHVAGVAAPAPRRRLLPIALVSAVVVFAVVGFVVAASSGAEDPRAAAAAFWSGLGLGVQIEACAVVAESDSRSVAELLRPGGAPFSSADLSLVLDAECFEYLQSQEQDDFVAATTVAQPPEDPSTTTEPAAATAPGSALGIAPAEFWVEGAQMSQPPCDGSWIAIVNSASAGTVIKALRSFTGSQYMRNDITCDSLNPIVPSGRRAGEPLYVVFYGPFPGRGSAQQQCLELGFTTPNKCYVAPLTPYESDRSVRFGPLD